MSNKDAVTADDTAVHAPFLRVVRGDLTEEELAALVAVLAARSRAAARPAAAPRGRWREGAGMLRTPLRPGPGAWRASVRTR